VRPPEGRPGWPRRRGSRHRTSRRVRQLPVRDENDYGLQMRRMMEAAGQALPPSLPVLEVNAAHPLLLKLAALPDGEGFNDLALLVQEQALLAEGSALPEPAAFVRRLNKLLAGG